MICYQQITVWWWGTMITHYNHSLTILSCWAVEGESHVAGWDFKVGCTLQTEDHWLIYVFGMSSRWQIFDCLSVTVVDILLQVKVSSYRYPSNQWVFWSPIDWEAEDLGESYINSSLPERALHAHYSLLLTVNEAWVFLAELKNAKYREPACTLQRR